MRHSSRFTVSGFLIQCRHRLFFKTFYLFCILFLFTRKFFYKIVYKLISLQVFHCLYNTNQNALIGAPTGSGKTLCAELAMFRIFCQYPNKKVQLINAYLDFFFDDATFATRNLIKFTEIQILQLFLYISKKLKFLTFEVL